MKWFKHQTSAADDEALILVRQEFGFEGYGRYWAILEIIAGRSRNDCFELALPVSEWCGKLAIRPPQLRRYLTATQQRLLWEWTEVAGVIKIRCPKLAKHRDEYSRKSGQTPDIVRTVDTDTELEEEKEPDTQPCPVRETAPPMPPTAARVGIPDRKPNPNGHARTDDDLKPFFEAYCAGAGQNLTWRGQYFIAAEQIHAHGKPPDRVKAVAAFYRSRLERGTPSIQRFAAEIDKWDAEAGAPKARDRPDNPKLGAPSGARARGWCTVHPAVGLDANGCSRCRDLAQAAPA